MTQNIYDDPEFFACYARLRRSVEGLDGAPEWPAMRSLLPDLRGASVADLGCGFGWFCRWAVAAGARAVVGIDVSERMLERAIGAAGAGDIDYRRADLEHLDLQHLDLEPASFDCVYSSLTLHYVERLSQLVHRVHEALVPGGTFVFSVEHPLFTAPSVPAFTVVDERRVWPVDGYLAEGPRTTDWLAPGVVKQHRTIGTYVTMLLDAGFAVTHLEEWAPTAAQVDEHPEWADERHRPPFLLVACRA